MSEGFYDYTVTALVQLIVTADTPGDAEEQAELILAEVCSDINMVSIK
jgi:SHS2 domain-containing protein